MSRVNIVTYSTHHRDELTFPRNKDPIILFTQFFIHKNKERHKENVECLKFNVQLGLFSTIYLLNEKIYSQSELELSDEEMKRIVQIDVAKRLSYSDFFKKVNELDLKGYMVLANSDIFFDTTIVNLRRSCLSVEKSMYTLLRFEYNRNISHHLSALFKFGKNPVPGSQDVWIYHTNFKPDSHFIKASNIYLGKPGCDNAIAYLAHVHGYKCINEPWNVRTFHNHASQVRDYVMSGKDTIRVSNYLFPHPQCRFKEIDTTQKQKKEFKKVSLDKGIETPEFEIRYGLSKDKSIIVTNHVFNYVNKHGKLDTNVDVNTMIGYDPYEGMKKKMLVVKDGKVVQWAEEDGGKLRNEITLIDACKPYKNPQRNTGSQKEIPSFSMKNNVIQVSGYQTFNLFQNNNNIVFKNKIKKFNTISKILKQYSNGTKTFTDVGCNNGLVSFIANQHNFERITCLDHDKDCIGLVNKVIKAKKMKNMSAQYFKFGSVFPSSDIVFCGAIIHWIFSLTADFRSFDKIIQYLMQYVNQYLFIEWVSEHDNAIREFQHIKRNARKGDESYTTKNFKRSLEKFGDIIESHPVDGINNSRILYIVKKKNIHHVTLGDRNVAFFEKKMSHNYSTSKIYVSGDKQYVLKKIIKYNEYDCFKREVYILKLLQQYEWCPKLLWNNGKDMIVTSYCGEPLTKENCPQNALIQVQKILKDLERKRVKHNDIIRNDKYMKKCELLVMNKKVYLCDFGWASIDNDFSCQQHNIKNVKKPYGVIDDTKCLTFVMDIQKNKMHKNLFIYWAQTFEHAPSIVKECVKSWEINCPKWNIIKLDDTNLKEYVNIEKEIPNIKKKHMTKTSYSDIVRIFLLDKYGGCWCDATTFCNKSLDSWLYKHIKHSNFFAFDRPLKQYKKLMISSWFLYSAKNNYIVQEWKKKTIEYWNTNNKMHDYFWFHQLFDTLYNTDKKFKMTWDKTGKINTALPHFLQHQGLFNEQSPTVKRHIDSRLSPMYKLTYKNNIQNYHPNCNLAYLLNH